MIERFAEFSGDWNPIHTDLKEARAYGHPRQVAHGAILVALISRVIGTEVPGPGAVWMGQSVEWLSPVYVGDEIELTVEIESISKGTGILFLRMAAVNQQGTAVMTGEAKVKMTEKTPWSEAPATTDRVALVTGGARGIGAEVARTLAASGMTVAINYRASHAGAKSVVSEIESTGGRALAFAGDIGDGDEAGRVIDSVFEAFGRIDVVVHGASPSVPPVRVLDLAYADIERYYKVYVGGALTLLARTVPRMTEQRFGRFIFMGTSFLFGVPPDGMAAYVAGKESLWGLVKALAGELGPKGITCNMVSPGVTVTDLTADLPARLKELHARKSPVRRLATTADSAAVIALLASEAGGYVNGVNMPVTGGPV